MACLGFFCVVCVLCVVVCDARIVDRRSVINREDVPVVRGANLGGWLVLEPWITPTIFEIVNHKLPDFNESAYAIVDEYTYYQHGPRAVGVNFLDLIKDHWDTWVTEEHIANLSAAGLNTIRVPVGYWYFDILPDEPFVSGQAIFPYALERLAALGRWAQKHGLRVLIDLHTAPGSQNGFDNSGRRGPIGFLKGDNMKRTETIIAKVTEWTLQNIPENVLFGVELLNEPNTFDPDFGEAMWDAMMKKFYPDGYTIVRNQSIDTGLVISSAFKPISSFFNYMQPPKFQNVWLDDHLYQCFGPDLNRWAYTPEGWSKHLSRSCADGSVYAAHPLPTFVGEFSLAVTDCTKWLTGINRTPFPISDGHPEVCDYYNMPYPKFNKYYRQFLNDYARAQMDAYEKANGWIFWNFQTENSPEWDFLLGWKEGWIPRRVDRREPYHC